MAKELGKGRFREKVLGAVRGGEVSSLGFRMMPMIDVLFLLLIFFLITSRFHAQESALPFNLPRESAEVVPGRLDPLEVHLYGSKGKCELAVAQSGKIEINETNPEAALTAFSNKFATVLVGQKRTVKDPVEFVCDNGVQWQYLAKVYNVLYGMGIEDVTFRLNE